VVTRKKIGRHGPVPVTELEIQTLRLWTDRNFNFFQHKANPPAEIMALHERFMSVGVAQPPNEPPSGNGIASATPGPDDPIPWHAELTRIEVRSGVILTAIVVSLLISVAAVAVALIP